MPLRGLARKLRAPATAALKRALSPRGVSPAAGPGVRATHSSRFLIIGLHSGEGSRTVNGIKNARMTLKDMEKWNKDTAEDYAEATQFINTLPRRIALSAGSAVFIFTSGLAYAFGALDRNRKYLDP